MCAGGQKKRAVPRQRRQAEEEEEEDVEAEFNPENPYQVSQADKLTRPGLSGRIPLRPEKIPVTEGFPHSLASSSSGRCRGH